MTMAVRAEDFDSTFQETMSDIYDLPLDFDILPRVIGRICALTRSPFGLACVHRAGQPPLEVGHGIAPDVLGAIQERAHLNLYISELGRMPIGQVVHSDDVVAPERWKGNELHEAVMRPAGLHRGIGLTVIETPVLAVTINVMRPDTSPDYAPEDFAALERVAGHLMRAFRLAERLERCRHAAAVASEALGRFDAACMVVNAAGRMVIGNARAVEVLAGPGSALRTASDRLVPAQAGDRRVWKAFLAQIGEGSVPGGLSLGHPERPLRLTATALAPEMQERLGLVAPEPMALILLGTFPVAPPDAATLAAVFGLTPAEAAVAAGIAAGERPADCARRLGRSLNTVRTHLKSVFAKTGVRRQAELVQLTGGLAGAGPRTGDGVAG